MNDKAPLDNLFTNFRALFGGHWQHCFAWIREGVAGGNAFSFPRDEGPVERFARDGLARFCFRSVRKTLQLATGLRRCPPAEPIAASPSRWRNYP